MNRIKVLLVDDNCEFLAVATDFLSRNFCLEIVGAARSGPEAIQLAGRFAPQLVLMDLSMPEMNGLETTRAIKSFSLPPRVIMLTLYEGAEFSASARAAGADGFITKSEFGDSLLPLIFRLFPDVQFDALHECVP